MMLFRAALESDLDSIHTLAELSGIGITTLPKDKNVLKKRLRWSLDSYAKNLTQPENEYYLFVLEDLSQKIIAGISAIESKIGAQNPFYSFKVSERRTSCESLNIRADHKVLNLVTEKQGCSEICTLFLNPTYRKNNNGIVLSKSRFLYMAQHPERFSTTVIADMRGVSDPLGNSPFWNHVGQNFFKMSYNDADKLTLITNKQFIADLMPLDTIYINLLDSEAQSVIGMAHPASVPAMNILLKEGFYYNNYIDIFDAGPTLEVPLTDIKTIKNSRYMTIKSITDTVCGAEYLVSTTKNSFRAIMCSVLVHPTESSCIISYNSAQALQIACGDTVQISPFIINNYPGK